MSANYIETDCTVEFQGRTFESGGAFISADRIVAYPAANGVLSDWHGRPIGQWSILSTWETPRSYISSTMHSILANVDGVEYVGRGAGIGMAFLGKRRSFRTARPVDYRRLATLTRRAMRARLSGLIERALAFEVQRDALLARVPEGYRVDAEEHVAAVETI